MRHLCFIGYPNNENFAKILRCAPHFQLSSGCLEARFFVSDIDIVLNTIFSVDADVDECSNSGICPPNSVCVNSEGSYDCECSNGYTKNENGVCQGK